MGGNNYLVICSPHPFCGFNTDTVCFSGSDFICHKTLIPVIGYVAAELAKSCGIPVAEYLRKRALGYAVKAVVPDTFYVFNEKLSELLNRDLSPETEAAALKLFDDIYAEIIDTPKQSKKEIIREVAQWQAQASGPSSHD